jgi:curved DNA-binding protein CbpA
LANVWHPDRFVGNPRLQKKAEEKLKEINAAYEYIKSLSVNNNYMTESD